MSAYDAISDQAKHDAKGYAFAHGEAPNYGHQAAMLRMYLIEMAENGETPDEFARRRGWIE